MCCMRTADIDWQCYAMVICWRVGYLTSIYMRIMCICLSNGANLTVHIIYRRMRNGNVIIITELVKDVCARIDRS
jgi:hypothetical protein